jgi:hypothetical protein
VEEHRPQDNPDTAAKKMIMFALLATRTGLIGDNAVWILFKKIA